MLRITEAKKKNVPLSEIEKEKRKLKKKILTKAKD